MSDEKDKARRNMSKTVVQARKTLRKLNDLHEMVEKDVLDAYNVIRNVMNDTTQPGATRKAAAKEVLEMYLKFAAQSAEIVGEPSNREEERDFAYSPVATFSVVPIKG